MRRSYIRWLIPILIIVAASVWIILPSTTGIHIGSFNRELKLVRGLDLQGGLQVLLEADLPQDVEIEADKIETTRDIIEERVNGLGVTEPLVQVAGSRRILVELPGIGDPEAAIDVIKETGLLEFVEMTRTDLVSFAPGSLIQTDYRSSMAQATITPTPMATPSDEQPTAQPTSPATEEKVFHTVMTGESLKDAAATMDQAGTKYVVAFELTEEGTRIFADFTRTHVQQPLGIVLDSRLISAPIVSEPIEGGQGMISGDFTLEEARRLAVQLRYGSLPVPLKEAETKTVGPTLGQDSLRKSLIAGFIGIAVVMLFMALYYRLPGLLADLALLIYATITIALFKLIPVTLTLPGIAGFVLSLGVAVDANVLIFERMKEELRAGRNLRQAVDMGFSRAWPSIRDSNLSTLITCGILLWFGSTFGASIVKGFSITLALGVLVSLFTAITVTRTFLHVVLDNIQMAKHPRLFGV